MIFEGGSVSISIDGTFLDTLSEVAVKRLNIVESIATWLPILELELVINEGAESSPTIHDGSALSVVINTDQFNHTFSFRVFYYGVSSEKESESLLISAYFDCPDIFRISRRLTYTGPSSEVARVVAQDSKLEFEGDSTKDSQVWMRDGIPAGSFLNHVTKHSYINDLSCMASGITRFKKLRFKNITQLMKSRESVVFTDQRAADVEDPKYRYFYNHSYKNNSGSLNRWKGYGGYAQNFDILAGQSDTVLIDKVSKHNKYLSLDSDVKPSFVEVGPFSCGNTHPNYFRAKVQNEKNLALFSSDLHLFGSKMTETSIFDVAMVSYSHDHMSSISPAISGKYVVSDVGIEITQESGVIVHYVLCRQGFNSSNTQSVSGVV